MPIKLCVGVTKKHGLPDYGSVGASCHVEVELDGALLQTDLDAFHRHVRNAYIACRQSVNDELAQHKGNAITSTPDQIRHVDSESTSPNHRNGNGTNGHRASQKQRNYANQLAGQIPGLGARRLESLAQKMFGKPLADLASLDASALIDMLKAVKDGQINLEDALDGAPA